MTLRAVYLATPVLALGIACSGMGGAKTQGDAQAGTTGASGDASASTATGTTTGARTIMGRVTQASSDQLVVETMEGRRETLNLHGQTAITIDGQVARVSDLQPGQMVRASYDEQAGQKNAVSIQAGHHDSGSMHGSGSVGGGTSGTVESPGAAGQAGDTGRSSDPGSYQSPGESGSGTGTGSTDTSGTGSTGGDTTSSGGTGSANDTGQSGDRTGQDAPGDPTGAGSDTSSTGGKY